MTVGKEKCLQKFAINGSLLPVKMHYLIYFAALACVLPFRTIYAKNLGVTGTETGVIFAVLPFIKILTNPLYGAIVDRFKTFRVTLFALLLIVGVSHVGLTFIPRQESVDSLPSKHAENTVFDDIKSRIRIAVTEVISTTDKAIDRCNISCESLAEFSIKNQSYLRCIPFWDRRNHKCGILSSEAIKLENNVLSLPNCSKILALDSKFDGVRLTSSISNFSDNFLNCVPDSGAILQDSSNVTSSITSPADWRPFYSLQFWLFLFLMIISTSSFTAVIFLVDVVCYEILDNKPELYGRQRLWGSIGWGTGSLLAGYFNQLFSTESETVDYSPCFYLLGVLVLFDLIPLQFIRVVNVKYSKNITKDVVQLIRNPSFLIHSSTIFCVGGLSGLIWNYEFWFLEDLGASHTLLGLTQTVQCFFSEVPCFIVAGWVCRKIGHVQCNSLTFLCFFIRYLAFVPMKNPWLALPVGLLHGPTFGLFFAAMTAYGREQALPGTEATVQACLQVVFEGLGVAAGSILGGIGLDKVGSRTTFTYAAIFSFIMLVLNVVIPWIVKRKSSKKTTQMSEGKSDEVVKRKDITTMF